MADTCVRARWQCGRSEDIALLWMCLHVCACYLLSVCLWATQCDRTQVSVSAATAAISMYLSLTPSLSFCVFMSQFLGPTNLNLSAVHSVPARCWYSPDFLFASENLQQENWFRHVSVPIHAQFKLFVCMSKHVSTLSD